MQSFTIVIIIIGAIIILSIIFVRHRILLQPFQIVCKIDITNKRQPSYKNLIEEWIIEQYRQDNDLQFFYNEAFVSWQQNCENIISHTFIGQNRQQKIYLAMCQDAMQEDYQTFQFVFFRTQTRYKQQNYQKYAYTVDNTEYVMTASLKRLFEIDNELKQINYETTLEKYDAKKQRLLMTPELKQMIKIRDHYTCQQCGKYMPDEVGLHIDHIVSIKKGGKSIPSNLQVLCDKCNLRKGK